MQVELLGHVAIRSLCGLSPVTGRPAIILAALALEGGPLPTTRLVDLLWTTPPVNELNALQRHVSRLRLLFRNRGVDDAVRHHGGFYELNRDVVSVDIDHLDPDGYSASDRRRVNDPPFETRWWLEPLPAVDHVDFIVHRRHLQQRCDALGIAQRAAGAPPSTVVVGRRRTDAVSCGCPLDGHGVGCDVPVEVSRQLRRWLEIRASDDEAAIVIRAWLGSIECWGHAVTGRTD